MEFYRPHRDPELRRDFLILLSDAHQTVNLFLAECQARRKQLRRAAVLRKLLAWNGDNKFASVRTDFDSQFDTRSTSVLLCAASATLTLCLGETPMKKAIVVLAFVFGLTAFASDVHCPEHAWAACHDTYETRTAEDGGILHKFTCDCGDDWWVRVN
jgi:hypothetical protein